MRTLALALAAVVVAAITFESGQTHGQVTPPMPPIPSRVVSLFIGCNNIALTYPDGTPVSMVAASVSPPEAVYAVWRLDPPSQTFEGFAPEAPQVSDLQFLNFLDAAFVCVRTPAIITMPAVEPVPVPVPLTEEGG